MPADLTPEQMAEIADAIAAGRKIEAVKMYRRHSGNDLKDSRDFIEKLTLELRAKDPLRFPEPTRTGCAATLLLIAVLAAAGFACR